MASNSSKRGLANASEETKKRVSSEGGKAPHAKRGQHGSDSKMSDNEMNETKNE